MVVTNSAIDAEENSSVQNISSGLAFDSINAAASAGGDVVDLIGRFNNAMDLIRQADLSDFRTCSESDCNTRANEILASIVYDSSLLKEEAQEKSKYDDVISYAIYLPLGVFALSFSGIFAYDKWKSRQINRLLNIKLGEK